jgi:hypothetical protein
LVAPIGQSAPYQSEEVLFAGTSYLIDAAQIPERFPLVTAAIGTGAPEPSRFEQQLRAAVLATQPRQFTLAGADPLRQGDTRTGTARALSMAFSHEGVELQQMEGKTLAIYEITAQVLFFDYGAVAKQIAASYPVRLRYTDTTDQPPSLQHRLEVVRTMLDPARQNGLVQVWLRKMAAATPRGGDRLVQVELPVFEDKALAMLPIDRAAVRQEVARFLEGVVSDEWNVPMVPLSTGHAIGGKMVQVFANGDATEFTLPEPTFRIGTTVRDLRKAQSPVEGGQRVAYGAFITSTVKGLLGTVAELRFKDVLSVTQTDLVPVQLDDWAQLDRTLQSVLANAIQQVKASDRSWTRANSPTPDADAQLDAIRTRLLAR